MAAACMHRLLLIRYALREVLLPALVAAGGLFLAIYLPVTGQLEAWHLPLIAGMLGTPLVAIGGERPPDTPRLEERTPT
jgi:hypothetical protein